LTTDLNAGEPRSLLTKPRDRSRGLPISQRSGTPHDQILSAAAQLFMEKGYHAASVREIGDRLRISQSSLYYHAKSKPQILVDLNRRFMERLTQAFEEIAASGDDPEAKLRAVIRQLVSVVADYQPEVTVVLQERRSLPGRHSKPIQKQRDRIDEIIDGILAEGIQQGVFRDVDPALSRLALTGMCNWAYAWYRPGGRRSPDAIAEHFAAIFLSGIKAG
jgi:TetR/AcrR family transcriptional regulator, cholesterol catabolism regulator